MQHITIYHNPTCSKSRQALQLLKEHEVELTVVQYKKNPPNVLQLQHILTLAHLSAKDIIRQNETLFKELKLHNKLDDDTLLLNTMANHPNLIERPIVLSHEKALVARPPERALELINS